jgi:catechol 2,3-dioxygenase-like lactoylglutathione lyase family enzyme
VTDLVDRIDETLAYYSEGLGAELVVPVERGDPYWTMTSQPIKGPEFDRSLLVRWHSLTADQREILAAWVRDHDCEPGDVPVNGGILGYDAATGEWRIRLYRRRDGRLHMAADGEPEQRVVRRVSKAPLPWPRLVHQ